jgi:hypothetical protein
MLILTSVTLVNSQKGSQIGRSSLSIRGSYLGGTCSSLLSMSRPVYRTGLTPPSAPPPLPISTNGGDGPSSEKSQGGPSPATSLQRSQFIGDMALNSSPLSHVPARPPPSPPNPNQLPLGSPESLRSLPPSSPQPDSSEKSLLLQTSSSSNDVPLLLEQLRITSLSKPNDVGRSPKVGSTSTGFGYPNRNPVPSLLDAATLDPQHLLCQAADGTVEAGTLEGLMDRLVTETHDRAKDNEVQRIFIATYRLFITGEELFGVLKRRFDEMGELSHAGGSIRCS